MLVTHTKKSEKGTFDKTTCFGTDHEVGTYVVTGGTGAYAKISGRGAYVTDVTFVGCSPRKPPILLMVTVVARGPVSF